MTLNGMMVYATTSKGQELAEFECCEDVNLRPYTAKCKVQRMRDGNMYITELKKRVRNTPIFREDNSSLSLGKDGKYYFVFVLPEERADELPNELPYQALAIAEKFDQKLNQKKGRDEK